MNKIKYIMETDNILILRELDIIYPSLFDLFNQNFTIMGEKKFEEAYNYINEANYIIIVIKWFSNTHNNYTRNSFINIFFN